MNLETENPVAHAGEVFSPESDRELRPDSLLQQVVELSGLSEDILIQELLPDSERQEKPANEMTLEELRSAMLEYLDRIDQDMNLS